MGEHRDWLAQGKDGVTGPVWQWTEGMGKPMEDHAEKDRRGISWFVSNTLETYRSKWKFFWSLFYIINYFCLFHLRDAYLSDIY